jgi:hypothetical protein
MAEWYVILFLVYSLGSGIAGHEGTLVRLSGKLACICRVGCDVTGSGPGARAFIFFWLDGVISSWFGCCGVLNWG